MQNTSKKVARIISALLSEHGITDAIVSPGSRNAPLTIALERNSKITTHVVIDERSAAFIALGMSQATKCRPVALVCTSGTAPLNYSPAIAEAFYQKIPLIVITADRPEEWIDQDDSQTIRQPGIYANFIKGTYNIPVESDDPDRMWLIRRKLNDAFALAFSGVPGPVHINVQLDEPLGEIIDVDEEEESSVIVHKPNIDAEEPLRKIVDLICSGAKVMFLFGFLPVNTMSQKLREIARWPNVVVLHEAQSNLTQCDSFIGNIDGTLCRLDDSVTSYFPDYVITMGGSLVSRMIKNYLRRIPNLRHISVDERDNSVDCFKHLYEKIKVNDNQAIDYIADNLPEINHAHTQFKTMWFTASKQAKENATKLALESEWCDFKAFHYILTHLPEEVNLQLSNGTSIRYTQLFDYSNALSVHCNRGVSGIDGCTSTALGFAVKSALPTILITGDMSMQYDIGALATTFIPQDFKIIVLNNGGGGIFRYIASTRDLEELEKYFVCDVRLPLKELCEAYGFAYHRASNINELEKVYPIFCSSTNKPSILEIKTDGAYSAKIITKYLSKK